jgi:hypothetical protein
MGAEDQKEVEGQSVRQSRAFDSLGIAERIGLSKSPCIAKEIGLQKRRQGGTSLDKRRDKSRQFVGQN